MTDEYFVGIDLGTTYSCISYIDEDGEPVIDKNAEAEDTTPSIILFNENDEYVVGSVARDQAPMYPPERTVIAIKRQIGTNAEIIIDGKAYNPTTLSAMILGKVIGDFNANHSTQLKKAVITCPAYFGNNEREATKTAGLIAGLEEVRIINEPTAAAISYGFGSGGEPRKVLVYDLGGGTFDVTILEYDGTNFRAIATDGERHLGGRDWDACLVEAI